MRTSIETLQATDLAKGWIHGSVVANDAASRLHAAFIAGHLATGLLALMIFPLWLAYNQSVTDIQAILFVWLVSPIFLAAYVSRTGRLERAVHASLVLFSGFVVWISINSGGLSSVALLLFCILPVEASSLGGRKTTIEGIVLALSGLAIVAVIDLVAEPGMFSAGFKNAYPYAILLAIIYSGFVALRFERNNSATRNESLIGDDRFNQLANTSTDLITLHDENGNIRFASSACGKMLGCTADALAGKGMFERIHLQDRVKFLKSLSDAMISGAETAVTFRVQPAPEDGNLEPTTKWLEMRCRKIASTISDIPELAAVTRDISDKMALETEREAQHASAEESNRAKSRFLASMSHELRTPLNAIIGFSDILNQDLFGKFEFEKHAEYAGLINQSGQHLLNLVNDILDISRIEAGRYELFPEEINLADISKNIVSMLSPQAQVKQLDVEISVDKELPVLTADPRACKQMLINLLSNAIKFSNDGGKIEIWATSANGFVNIFVKDQGIGMSSEELQQVGLPFSQIDARCRRNYEGSGLGLFMVKGLVELHNGQLEISSQPGRGTCAIIRLPLHPEKSRPVPLNENATLVHIDKNSRKPNPQPFRSNRHAFIQAKTS